MTERDTYYLKKVFPCINIAVIILWGGYFLLPAHTAKKQRVDITNVAPIEAVADSTYAVSSAESAMVSYVDISHPKQTGFQWDHSSNIMLNEDGVTILMSEKVVRSRYEISLDNNDDYEMTFFLNNSELIKQMIKAHYLPPPGGLYKHELKVPASVSRSGFDSVHIRPLEGDMRYSLGHIEFFE